MKDADLIQALKRIKVQTGGLICLGCGHEHNCGVHGCAVIREAVLRLEERMEKGTLELGEPLTQADISQMDYEKIWIEYKDGTGEWALAYAGNIYNIDTLEGAGFGGMLQDAMQGERLDRPTGQYTAYRRKKEHIDREALHGGWEGTADGYSAGELVYDVWRCGDCGHVEETDDPDLLPRFCPSCGRAMMLEAWAELEKRLRG